MAFSRQLDLMAYGLLVWTIVTGSNKKTMLAALLGYFEEARYRYTLHG